MSTETPLCAANHNLIENTIARNHSRPVRVSFGDLAIGARFHVGKHYGMGARSHVQNWQELEKTDKQKSVVRVAHGDLYAPGHSFTFNRMTRVWPL